MLNEPEYQATFERVFLLEDLPEPLTRSSEHLQYFDNYIENTRLCLRTIRAPHTKEWTWILEQKFPARDDCLTTFQVSRLYLSEPEHKAFEHFEGREIAKNERAESSELRFNRYFFEHAGKTLEIDVYLNPLWGLTIARFGCESIGELRAFEKPGFAFSEITENRFFHGANLVGKTFADVQAELLKISGSNQYGAVDTI